MLVGLVVLSCCAFAQQSWRQSISFTTAENIALLNPSGLAVTIGAPEKTLRLYVFLSPECPLCRNYSIVLNKLGAKYNRDLEVYGIVPGNAYSGQDVSDYAKDFQIQFPLLIDSSKKLTAYLAAKVTPEVVLTNQSGAVVYRGAIDDWVVELGKKKAKPQQHYLDAAINQYLGGKPVLVPSTVAKGCLINEI